MQCLSWRFTPNYRALAGIIGTIPLLAYKLEVMGTVLEKVPSLGQNTETRSGRITCVVPFGQDQFGMTAKPPGPVCI